MSNGKYIRAPYSPSLLHSIKSSEGVGNLFKGSSRSQRQVYIKVVMTSVQCFQEGQKEQFLCCITVQKKLCESQQQESLLQVITVLVSSWSPSEKVSFARFFCAWVSEAELSVMNIFLRTYKWRYDQLLCIKKYQASFKLTYALGRYHAQSSQAKSARICWYISCKFRD